MQRSHKTPGLITDKGEQADIRHPAMTGRIGETIMNENVNLSEELNEEIFGVGGDTDVAPNNEGSRFTRQALLNAINAGNTSLPCNEYANQVLAILGVSIGAGNLLVAGMINWLDNRNNNRNMWVELQRFPRTANDGRSAWSNAMQGIPTIAIAPAAGGSAAHVAILRPTDISVSFDRLNTLRVLPPPGQPELHPPRYSPLQNGGPFLDIQVGNGGAPRGVQVLLRQAWGSGAHPAIRFFAYNERAFFW